MSALVPPQRVRSDSDEPEGEKRRQGSETWSNRVVDPAVPGSALYAFARLMGPGLKSMVEEPISQPVRAADEISATRRRPVPFSLL